MRFEFATATRIVFGEGVAAELGTLAVPLGRRAFFVTGSTPARWAGLHGALAAQDIAVTVFSVAGEPDVPCVLGAVEQARGAGCDFVVGCGGGSAIDAGKAVAALLANQGDLFDYLEVIGRGRALETPSLPFVAVPTTSGTGAEVTRNAVLASPEHRVKVSLRSALMLPTLALVDPLLTLDLPPAITAATGLDALTQCVEPFVSCRSHPLTDAVCREGMQRAARSLRRACEHGHDAAARTDMSLASLMGGLALANAGLGGAHGFAGPLGGRFDAPHGALCARLLPLVTEMNVRALRERAPQSSVLDRYDEVGRLLTGRAEARAADAVAFLSALCEALGIPGLAGYGLTEDHVPEVVAQAAVASSMKGNPIPLTSEELTEILQRAL